MAAVGIAKGISGLFSKSVKGSKGVFKNKAGELQAKPGYTPNAGGGVDKGTKFTDKILRNPGKSAAIGLGGTALGYYGYQSFAGGGASAPTDTYGASSGSSSMGMPQSGGYGGYY